MMIHPSPRRFRRALQVALLALACAIALLPSTSTGAPSQAELEAAKERLMELEKEFELVVEEYNLVNERLTSIQVRLGTTQSEINDLQKRMDKRRGSAVVAARQLYRAGSSVTLEAILSSDSLADVQIRMDYLKSSQSAQTKVFERLSADQDTLDRKMVVLEEARVEAQQTQSQLAELRSEVEAKLAAQEDEIADLVAKIEAAEAAAARRQRAAEAAQAAAAPPSVSVASIPSAKASNPRAQTAVDAALSQVGKPYQWGAAGPDSYDCSGLTMWAWAHAGVSLPHNSGMQYAATARVAYSDLEPGDLLFFGSPIHHVGMYIGGGQMVEAPYSGQQVRVVSSSRSDFVGGGRPGV